MAEADTRRSQKRRALAPVPPHTIMYDVPDKTFPALSDLAGGPHHVSLVHHYSVWGSAIALGLITHNFSSANLCRHVVTHLDFSYSAVHPSTNPSKSGGLYSSLADLWSNTFMSSGMGVCNAFAQPAHGAYSYYEAVEALTSAIGRAFRDDPDTLKRAWQAAADALAVIAKLPRSAPTPAVAVAEDGEVVLEWNEGDKRAVAGFDGDGKFGYAIFKSGKFVPGEHEGIATAEGLPPDFAHYLRGAA